MDLTLWLHKEEVKWFSVDEAKTEASELQPFQVRESRIKVAARSVEERDTSNGKKGQPLRAAPFVKETKAYASNTSRSIEPDKQSNRLQIHTRSEVMAIEGKRRVRYRATSHPIFDRELPPGFSSLLAGSPFSLSFH